MMKIVELVAKVKTSSMQEIEEMVDRGLEIEQIEYLLFYDNETTKEILFRNEKLKQLLFKQINSYVIGLFTTINRNPKWEMNPNLQKICENYLKSFFKESLELEFASERGRTLSNAVLNARKKKKFIQKATKKYNIWKKYFDTMKKFAQMDMDNISKEQAEQYMLTFEQAIIRMNSGYNIPEAEATLKIAQREDIDITQFTALDKFMIKYQKQRANLIKNMTRMDEVFSIALDYDTLLKTKGIKRAKIYSPIKEMEETIRKGQFGKNNSLSKEEFAFTLKMLQNPETLASDTNQKLTKILSRTDIKINIGKREIKTLLSNKEMLEQIGEVFPDFQNRILKQIDSEIYSIIQDIGNKKREITSEEMNIYSNYLKNCFELSLNKNYDTVEMSKIFCLSTNIAYPNMNYNLVQLNDKKETVEFFKKELKENHAFLKYDSKIKELIDKLHSEQTITQEEFKRYDEIFHRYSYIIVLDNVDNVKTIKGLEKRSKELQLQSRTIENQIEQFIFIGTKGNKKFEQQEFYEVILDYYNRQLEKSAIDINRNAAVSHLIRAAQKGKIPEDIATIVLDKLEERKSKNLIPEISNTRNLEEYMQNVTEIRLQQGRMPRECSEFIIKQAILQKTYMAKYNGIIERALEDFSEYELEEAQINDYLIRVTDQPFFGGENINGVHVRKFKEINLSRQKIQSKGIVNLLDTILHESTHAKQYLQIKNGQLNRDTYKILKEEIIRQENRNFYKSNYNYMYNEIDARKSGYVKRFKLLRRIGLTDSQIAEVQAGNIKEKISEYCKYCERGKVKKLGQEKKDVNTMFLELLQQKPELLDKYPELGIEFERNERTVQRRNFAKILNSYEQMLNQTTNQREIEKISSWFSEMLLNSGQMSEERMQEELEELIEFKSKNPIIKAYKKKLLLTRFPKQKVLTVLQESGTEGRNE